jgi:hypothetical protein
MEKKDKAVKIHKHSFNPEPTLQVRNQPEEKGFNPEPTLRARNTDTKNNKSDEE